MSARVEAAAKVLMLQSEGVELNDGYLKDATEVLAAADAVMFDDAAVERLALMLAGFNQWTGFEGFKPEPVYTSQAHAIIALLKGDDERG